MPFKFSKITKIYENFKKEKKRTFLAENEKSATDGQIGAKGLECKIFVSSGVIFGFYEKNTPGKKLCVSDTFEF